MNKYKVICNVIKPTEKEVKDYPIYVEAENEIEAEKNAKYYWLLERPDHGFFGVKTITLI